MYLFAAKRASHSKQPAMVREVLAKLNYKNCLPVIVLVRYLSFYLIKTDVL